MNSNTPFADPLWLTRGFLPYYTESHRRLQEDVRKYVDTHVTPFCEEWESKGAVPQEVRPVLDIDFFAPEAGLLIDLTLTMHHLPGSTKACSARVCSSLGLSFGTGPPPWPTLARRHSRT